MSLQRDLEAIAEQNDFSGVAVVEQAGVREVEVVAGAADRAARRPIDIDTGFGTASGTKGFTALTIVSLIESGRLDFSTPLVELTGRDLPAVDPAVTIEHLLGHTSGVGDYLDEEQLDDIDDHVLGVPVHQLEGPGDYLPLLNRHPQVSEPDTRFVYNNSGYLMLALAIERAGGGPYHRLVTERVFEPAGMTSTAFHRSDALPAGTALGYLKDGRTNIFHLPVVGTGDGGAYTTAGDMSSFWQALVGERIVSARSLARMVEPRNWDPSEGFHHGLGFWLGDGGPRIMLEGMDAGVSFQSSHRPDRDLTFTIISNTSSGAWPLASFLATELAG